MPRASRPPTAATRAEAPPRPRARRPRTVDAPRATPSAPTRRRRPTLPPADAPADGCRAPAQPAARRRGDSRRARSRAASPPTPASTCAPLAGKGSGPDGRIVRIDVERALAGGTRRPPAAPRRGARRPAGGAPGAARGAGAGARGRHDHRSEPDAARRRAPHERVEVAGAALLPAVRDRHGQGARAARGAQRRARRRRRQADGQRPDRARLRARAARPPAVPPLVGRRQARTSTARRTSASRSRSTRA